MVKNITAVLLRAQIDYWANTFTWYVTCPPQGVALRNSSWKISIMGIDFLICIFPGQATNKSFLEFDKLRVEMRRSNHKYTNISLPNWLNVEKRTALRNYSLSSEMFLALSAWVIAGPFPSLIWAVSWYLNIVYTFSRYLRWVLRQHKVGRKRGLYSARFPLWGCCPENNSSTSG